MLAGQLAEPAMLQVYVHVLPEQQTGACAARWPCGTSVGVWGINLRRLEHLSSSCQGRAEGPAPAGHGHSHGSAVQSPCVVHDCVQRQALPVPHLHSTCE